jgi:riboflavin synthase
MFTGIIEAAGTVEEIRRDGGNIHFTLSCTFARELRTDQSLAHNGVCLTVVNTSGDRYTVTAIDETLRKTNLGDLKAGDRVNLERCLQMNGRLDGHIVQGHVDAVAVCTRRNDLGGSWEFRFSHEKKKEFVTVEKGSVTVNGVSLTVVDSKEDSFSVHIIPYTFDHTNFNAITEGSRVNLEFDVIGKYVARLMGK